MVIFRKKRQDPKTTEPVKGKRKRHFLSYKRRWALWGSLFLIIALLIVYNFLTESERVRRFVQSQLTTIIGGPVHVDRAGFTLLRGLVIEEVTVKVDGSSADDATLLTAERMVVSVDYSRLLRLDFSNALREILADNVRISLVENAADNTWNFERLLQKGSEVKPEKVRSSTPGPSVGFPGIQIHNAVVNYLRKGEGETKLVGSVQVDATTSPMAGRRYGFIARTKPAGDNLSTSLVGVFDRRANEIVGRVGELHVNQTVQNMLPASVANWFREYGFAGRFSVPAFKYRFASATQAETFQIQLRFKETQATVQPRHWLSSSERWNMELMHQTLGMLDMLGMAQPLSRSDALASRSEDVAPRDRMARLYLDTRSVPLYLEDVNGTILFSESQIDIEQLSCRVQGQLLDLAGKLQGYTGDAPGFLVIKTSPGTYLQIPPDRRFMSWLPDDVRKAYLEFKPRGKGTLDVQLAREVRGGPFEPTVVLEVTDTVFEFDDFPYPLQHCQGRFVFDHDSTTGEDMLRIDNLHGHGVPGGPNINNTVYINGTIGPFVDGHPGVDVHVRGDDIHSEPAIRKAFPPEVAHAMLLFGPLDYGKRLAASGGRSLELSPEETFDWPRFTCDFSGTIRREPGKRKEVNTEVEMRLRNTSGTFKLFPYPMENLSCLLKIRDDYLQIENLRMQRNGADLTLNGTVRFTDPVAPEIFVDAKLVPLNDDLFNALPPTERSWVQRAGLGGRIDIGGRIYSSPTPDGDDTEVNFDLNLCLHDATLLKEGARGPAMTGLNGDMMLQPARLHIKGVTGRRGDADIHLAGDLDWADGTPNIRLDLQASNLLLDKALHDILPTEAQATWDEQKPEGTTDLDLTLALYTPPAHRPAPASQPVDRLKMVIHPRQLSVRPAVFPLRIDDLKGEIIVDDKHVTLNNVTGRHGKTRLQVQADGSTAPLDFRIKADAADVVPDAQWLKALPGSVADVIRSMKLEGKYGVHIDKLDLRQSASPRRAANASSAQPATEPSTASATTQPVDADFNCTVTAADVSADVSLPITHVTGSIQLEGEVRADALTRLDAKLDLRSFEIYGRKGEHLTATLRRPPFSQDFLVQSLRSQFAGGSIAGEVTIQGRDESRSQYAVSMIVQNASLAQIAGNALKRPAPAVLSGSFDGEGIIGDLSSRRGVGHIQIVGRDMYEAPIVLGFFRVVNLALPVRDGVNQVDVSYTLQRDRATLDSIEMRSPGLRIYGDGVLDFSRKEVNLTLNTENPDSLPVPLFNQLVRKAREELLQIRIKGSMQEPKVEARTLPTFQTTLDAVVEDVRKERPK